MARRGQRFTHLTIIDPAWRPEPGQKYRGAPKAAMIVTRVTAHGVYYRYDDGGTNGIFTMHRPTFDERYPEES